MDALAVIKARLGGDIILINPTSFLRSDLAFIPSDMPTDKRLLRDGQPIAAQHTQAGTLIAAGDIHAYAAVALVWADGEPLRFENGLTATPYLLENNYMRVELNQNGDICRIFDKVAQREVLPENAVANQWQAFEDRPLNWDAWDIDIFYDDKLFLAEPAESMTLIENGPLRATIAIKRRILNSSYSQHISLSYNSRRLDFATEIDWRERHILLKTAFPVDILSPVATYEVQWGHVQRPTHRNTSWDWARFETCAQKWVDLSEGNYGVAVLNDCKYGHDINNNIIRISLLRAPTMPDPEADQGKHQFTYAFFLHDGVQTQSVAYREIIAEAYCLNDPLIATIGAGTNAEKYPQFIKASGSAIVETVKQAEDGRGIVVRLYEGARQRGWVTLDTGWPLVAAFITNLLEEDQETITVSDNSLRVYLKPFQIVTLRLVFS